MDAAEDDRDLQVQRASPELLADLQASLPPFLWRSIPSGQNKIRRRVRVKETDRIVALLEPFQELPQLLDPHLQTLLPVLADAFIASLQAKRPSKEPVTHTQLLIPLSRAICRLLYTFCKIRGEKVIVRFLSTDTKHLELLLSAIEAGVEQETRASGKESESADTWEWEERYITLLWLSQLLLAPFDLATISSFDPLDTVQPDVSGLLWPPDVPRVTCRVVGLATRYLSSSGKERDAAKILLVRVALRRDMQEIGILHALVQWAISSFRPSSEAKSSYYYIGILAFLAGILNSSISTSDMNPYLFTIFQSLPSYSTSHDGFTEMINSSVVARKTTLKVLRNICAIVLRKSGTPASDQLLGIVENTIGVLLESLADSATPVRLAASKALSVITLKLPADMAAQVVEEVISSLSRNVLIVNGPHGKGQDLSRVNPAEWHGLILTLSQLLYRRSPPATSLSDILQALLTGLCFEQRSTSGASIGTNVRDAACFGIWALARRYTTDELQAIKTGSAIGYRNHEGSSVLQLLATELVVSASLDPAGNIRRGSSAALQELIGRHPNTIVEGIQVVQVVDYHAVALRSRAIMEVAFQSSQLAKPYMTGILNALLGWRGIGDGDASARRTTAMAFGRLARIQPMKTTIERLKVCLEALQTRQDDERHGLWLCLASRIECLDVDNSLDLREVISILEVAKKSKYRRVDLVAEALSTLVTAACKRLQSDEAFDLAKTAKTLVDKWLRRNEIEVIDAVSEGAFHIFQSLHTVSQSAADFAVHEWIGILDEPHGGRTSQNKGILATLFKILPVFETGKSAIIEAIQRRWASSAKDVETHAAILKYMSGSSATSGFTKIISDGLDDYTTNARGDVGSLVRIEALKAARTLWVDVELGNATARGEFVILYGKLLRLAAEKLDKVRIEAHQTLACTLPPSAESGSFKSYSPSSKQYFHFLLDMQAQESPALGPFNESWSLDLFEGYVGSADTGSEDLVRASRAALAEFCEAGNTGQVASILLALLKRNIDNDRILVPTLEAMAFLFDAKILQKSTLNWRSVYLTVQKAHYKTGNVRKLEAAIHVYGGLAEVYPQVVEKLTTMVLHPFPRVRNQAVDALFAIKGVGKGVDWLKAGKEDLVLLK